MNMKSHSADEKKMSKINKKPTKKARIENKDHDADDVLQQQCQSYYDRLLHQCRKELQKQSKVVKNFECQKIVRKIKELSSSIANAGANSNNDKDDDAPMNDDDDDDRVNTSNKQQQQHHQEQRLEFLKHKFPLDRVIQEAFRRLGILLINPSLTMSSSSSFVAQPVSTVLGNKKNSDDHDHDGEDKDGETKQSEARRSSNPEQKQQHQQEQGDTAKSSNDSDEQRPDNHDEQKKTQFWVDRMLQHKRMREALENWNDQVTEYRRWVLKQQDRQQEQQQRHHEHGPSSRDNNKNKKPKKQRQWKRERDEYNQEHQQHFSANDFTKGLFVQLGVRDADNGGGDERNYYGPDDDSNIHGYGGDGGKNNNNNNNKNRPGQRARQAKAMAMQAKKEGRHWDSSLNWRKRKDPPADAKVNEQDNNNNRHQAHGNHHNINNNIRNSISHNNSNRHANDNKMSQASGDQGGGEVLHPSWMAARKARNTNIATFSGTKITFNDADD